MDELQTRRKWMQQTAMGTSGLLIASSWSAKAFAQGGSKPISVRVVDKAGYDKIIAANKGKVVVVDCWATWCVPCRKAFPETVKLSKAYADKGVVVVSLCFDEPVKGQVPDKVKEFLVKQDAQFENLLSSLDISDSGADAFDIAEGALPHFKIYGKDGKLFKTFESGEDKEFTHEQIETAVKAVIKVK
ncbi:MAG: redoxin family protein [Candidatus Saccharimonas sp.]|nr:redoxin family protein [Planctomycetaceae bacterium]